MVTSPLIFSESGFILNAGSVSICAVTEPSSGPAESAPEPVIVYPPPLSTTDASITYDPAGP